MQIHPPAGRVVQWTEAGDALLFGVVQLRGVLHAQHPGIGTQTLLGTGAMGGQHRLGGDLGMIEQAVGGARATPTPAGGGNAHRRLVSQGLDEAPGATIAALIAEVDRGEFRGQRAHAATPSARRKSATSG